MKPVNVSYLLGRMKADSLVACPSYGKFVPTGETIPNSVREHGKTLT